MTPAAAAALLVLAAPVAPAVPLAPVPPVAGIAHAAPAGQMLTTAACLDLNAATQAEIESARGVGVELAERILQARRQGPFLDWEDARRRVRGLTRKAREGLLEAGFRIGGGRAGPNPCGPQRSALATATRRTA